MSPATDNFIHSLVEMSKAFETLPLVQQDLVAARAALDEKTRDVMDRELSILSLKAEIEALNQRNRDLEVSRDDAELRFLEADERTARAVDFIKATFGSAGALIQALEPPKPLPEPEPTPEPIADIRHDYDPPTSTVGYVSEPSVSPQPAADAASPSQSEVSQQGPTESAFTMTTTDAPAATPEVPASPTEQAASTASLGPYAGKRYHDVPTYIPLNAWLAGGGTEADYLWRP